MIESDESTNWLLELFMIGFNDVIDLFILLSHFVELSSGNQSTSSFEGPNKVAILVSECDSCNFQFLV